jgi:uncharacterized protein with HEPN domain
MLSRRDKLSALDMLNAARRAIRYARAVDEAEFVGDEMRVDAAMNALSVLGEASKRISPDGRRELPGLNWRQLADIRQFVVHKYFLVDPLELRETILREIPAIVGVLEAALGDKRTGGDPLRDRAPSA